MGHGHAIDSLVPTRVEKLRLGGTKIVMVAAGHEHSIAATSEGDVFTWGCGTNGCLGFNDEADRLVPMNINRAFLGGCGVVMVAAGSHHSIAVTSEGALFSWGCGSQGQLGLGDRDGRLSESGGEGCV